MSPPYTLTILSTMDSPIPVSPLSLSLVKGMKILSIIVVYTQRLSTGAQENMKRIGSIEEMFMHAYRMLEKPYPRMVVRIWYSNHLGKWHRVTYSVGLFRKPDESEVITAVVGFKNEHGHMERLSKRKADSEVQCAIGKGAI